MTSWFIRSPGRMTGILGGASVDGFVLACSVSGRCPRLWVPLVRD